MKSIGQYIIEYQSSPDDVRVTIDGKFYKLNPYQPNAYPFAWGIKGDDSLVTCKLNAPDWKRVHAVLFADKFSEEIPERSQIKHQGRIWFGPINIVVFWEEMTSEQSVEATKELVAKWNKKYPKKPIEPQKTVVVVGDTYVKLTDTNYNKNITDKSNEDAYAIHLSDYKTKREKLSNFLKDRAEHQEKKLGKMSMAEWRFRRYQENYFLNMKTLRDYIIEGYADTLVQNAIEPNIVFHGFDLEKINHEIDGAGEYGLTYYTVEDTLTCETEDGKTFFVIEPSHTGEYKLYTVYQWVYDLISELGYEEVELA